MADHVVHRAGLQRPPVVQHAQAVAEELGLVEVVGDQHRRDTDLAAELRELQPEPPPRELIHGGERLVEQQDPGVARERPRERHPLALPARELRRPGVLRAPPC